MIKRLVSSIKGRLHIAYKHIVYQRYGDPSMYKIGSPAWFVATEKYYGGLQKNVPRKQVSDLDPRTSEEIKAGGMIGGDRMWYHGYAEVYARYLERFKGQDYRDLVVVEFGILKGTGLALWSDLFRGGQVVGCDIDLSNSQQNMNFLKSKGAFQEREPELYLFDQFKDGASELAKILAGRRIDVCIDDGFHSRDTIVNCVKAVLPHLSEDAVMFVEDNKQSADYLNALDIPGEVLQFGEMCVLDMSSENRSPS